MTVIAGIDPGLKGGLALVHAETGKLDIAKRMPTTELRGKPVIYTPEIRYWLSYADRVVIEQVNPMPKQGVSSCFRFGMVYGGLLACAELAELPIELVTPAVWKKHFSLSSSKRASLDAARRRFGPSDQIDYSVLAEEGKAEAALIAAWWIDKRP